MTHRGEVRGWRAGSGGRPRLPERLAAAWSWGPDPIKTTLFFLLAPASLFAGALGAMGWSWWQRLLAGTGAIALGTYVVLVLLGFWRLRRKVGAQPLPPKG
ncbi:hypothetical protein AB0C96_41240 [Streptomyces sp. NPDC048506]|uniref:hypothetical protein n=1 Tax=Streptomyces sp. NPDC048506 TaxID=3155028 RepID=UPI00342A5470